MRKKYKFVVLAAAAAVSLAACGKKETAAVISSSEQVQETPAEIHIAEKESQPATTVETMPLSEADTTEAETTKAETTEAETTEAETIMELSPESKAAQKTVTNQESAYPDEYQNYEGRWINTESSRCSMEIHANGDGTYAIEITWSNSAAEYYQWNMTGRPSQKRRGGGLDYTDGVRTLVTFLDENTSQSKVEVTGEQGNFFLNEIGIMHWTDPAENEGEPVEFASESGN